MKFDVRLGDAALIVATAAILALLLCKSMFNEPPKVDKNSDFDVERAVSRLSRILGEENPHPVDSDENDAVRNRLIDEIRMIGYEPEIRDDFSCRQLQRRNSVTCARVRNVIFKAGDAKGAAIAVTAHYDSVGAGPGASDDGAGLAAALEIAAILKKVRPVKPILFLLTDGEEAGLIGAHSFVRKDALAQEIDAVVNMEARGASGPAILFETSANNARDIDAFSKRAKAPVGNSLTTDIYKMLPNDTDLSEYLALDIDALNFAYSDRLSLYHTPLDNIANLDRRSFMHLGASALAGMDGFLRDVDFTDRKPEQTVVFTDLLSRQLLVLPQLAGAALVIFGLALSFASAFKAPRKQWLIVFGAPLIGVASAALFAFASLSLINAIRSEAIYWSASPIWTRSVIYVSSIIGGFAALVVSRNVDRHCVLAAVWALFSTLGVVAFNIAPGSALLFGVPAALFGCAALASYGASRLLSPFSLLGSVAALLLWLSTLHHAEIGLGLGSAWPFSLIGALLFMMAVFATPQISDRAPAIMMSVSVIAWIAAIIAAVTVPAYSIVAPRPLNIQHIDVAGSGESYFALSPTNEPPPAAMLENFNFAKRTIGGLKREYFAADAPAHNEMPVGVDKSASDKGDNSRSVSLQLQANGADEIILVAPEEARLSLVNAGDETFAFGQISGGQIRCYGRSCADFTVSLEVGAEEVEWTIIGVHYGLGEKGAEVADTRPEWAVPIQSGDARLVVSQTSI